MQDAPDTVGLVLDMLPAGCADADKLDCVDRAAYLHDLFYASDTTVAMLTDVPNSGPSNAPIPFAEALKSQQITDGLTHGGASRLLVENVIAPNVGPLQATLDEMTSAVESGPPAAFKVYTAWSPTGTGYSLEDPTIGLPTVQHAHDLGVKVFVAHKGLPLVNFDPTFNHPEDIVAVSRLFPDMQFVVYHGAWDPSQVEGPYDPNATIGIDTLVAALDRHGVPPNDNVWADLGTTWRQLLTQPDQAAHALGNLLSALGTAAGAVGHRRHLVRQPPTADHGHASLPDHPAVPGPLRLPRVDRRREGRHLRPQCRPPLRHRRHGHALCPDRRSADLQHRRGGGFLRDAGALPSAWSPHGPTTRRQVLDWLASPLTRWVPS